MELQHIDYMECYISEVHSKRIEIHSYEMLMLYCDRHVDPSGKHKFYNRFVFFR